MSQRLFRKGKEINSPSRFHSIRIAFNLLALYIAVTRSLFKRAIINSKLIARRRNDLTAAYPRIKSILSSRAQLPKTPGRPGRAERLQNFERGVCRFAKEEGNTTGWLADFGLV